MHRFFSISLFGKEIISFDLDSIEEDQIDGNMGGEKQSPVTVYITGSSIESEGGGCDCDFDPETDPALN